MVAESSTARRPALPAATSGRRAHRTAPLRALLVGLLAGLLPLAASGMLPAASVSPARAAVAIATATPTPTPTPAVDAAAPQTVTVTVAPVSLAPLRAGENLTVTVKVTNDTAAAIAPGTVEVYLAGRALTTRSSVDRWLHPDPPGKPGDLMLRSPLPASIPATGTATFPIVVPAAEVGLTSENAWGPRGLSATLTSDGTVLAQGRGTFVWYSDEVLTPVSLAVAMPITVPGQATGLIPAQDLVTYTGATGTLTRQLDGVAGRDVTLAVDPMIIASIRVLGTSAPAGATAWLNRLAQAKNEIFPLGYADADIALEAQASAGTLLAPTSFDQAINPSLFAAPTANPTTPPTPVPPAAGSGKPPTTEQLLAWNYTATDVGWPVEGTVAAADLDVFTASGLGALILGGTNTSRSDSDETPNTAVTLTGGHGLALVTDRAVSAALRAASTAPTDAAWRVAMAELSSQLAAVSAENPGAPRTLLATLDRGAPPTGARLADTLDALAALPWRAPATLAQARAVAPAADVSFQSQSVADTRLAPARAVLEREHQVLAFATALSTPAPVTGAQRLDTLSLLSTGWAAETEAWRSAVDASLTDSATLLRSITVSTKGPINIVSSKVDLLITLDNALSQAVTVRVQVVPSNGRLLVGGDLVDTTIEAASSRAVKVPVTAAVGNGAVALRVTLFAPDGSVIDQPSQIPVNVHADWEGIGATIIATLLVLFFGFGIWRNVLRRRRERDAAASPASPASPEPSPAVDRGR